MIYNIALTFDKEVDRQIYDLYASIKDGLHVAFGLKGTSIPHCTVLKFESLKEVGASVLDDILNGVAKNISVDLSGVTLLPSHSDGCWVEVSILKDQELIDLQNELLRRVNNVEIKSDIREKFRPHITLAKTKDCKIRIDDLDHNILRKRQIHATLEIGLADDTFEFRTLQKRKTMKGLLLDNEII